MLRHSGRRIAPCVRPERRLRSREAGHAFRGADEPGWIQVKLRLLGRNRLYEGRVFNVVVDDVEYPSGNKSIREVAEHPGGSVAVALFPDRRIVLVNQHRYPFDEFLWELPAGKLNPGEDPLDCARRELEEETGHRGSAWKKLASIYTSPGFCSEVLHLFLAEGLTGSPAE